MRAPRLFEELNLCHADGSFPKRLAAIAKVSVLIIDDFAISPMGARERTVIPPTPNQNPPATVPQPQPVYLFQNTLPGTYNMGKDQNQAQVDGTDSESGLELLRNHRARLPFITTLG